MKKSAGIRVSNRLLIFLAIAATLIALAVILNYTTKTGVQTQSPLPSSGIKIFGMNPEEIPQTPEELKEKIRTEYLKQEWGKIIGKIPVIGHIHKFLVANPAIFKVIFGEPYAFSLIFFIVFILWIFIAIQASKMAGTVTFAEKWWVSLLFGVAFAVLLAQAGIFRGIVTYFFDLVFGKKDWWIRMILWLAFIALIIGGDRVFSFFSKYIHAYKVAKKAQQETATVKKTERRVNILSQSMRTATEIPPEERMANLKAAAGRIKSKNP